MQKPNGDPTPTTPAPGKTTVFTTVLRDKWSWLTGAAFVLLALPYIVPIVSAERWAIFVENYADPLLILIVLGSIAVSSLTFKRPADRRFWKWIAVALGFWLTCLISYVLFPYAVATPLGDLSGDLFYTLFYMSFMFAGLTRPHIEDESMSSPRLHVLERVTSAAILLFMVAYFVVIPSTTNYENYATWLPSLYLFLALDILLLVRFTYLSLTSVHRIYRRIYGLIACAMGAWAVSDLLETLTWAGKLDIPAGTAVDILWWPPYLLIAAAVLTHRSHVEKKPPLRILPSAPSAVSVNGQVVVAAFVLPMFHVGLYGVGLMDPNTRGIRDLLVFSSLVTFSTLVITQQYILAGTNKMLRTDLSEANQQLQQASKMEAIGRLAGGVAHDFNNLLTAMTGRVQLLLRRLPENATIIRTELNEINRAADRATSLTRQLLSFSRKQVLQPQYIDPNAVISELDKMLRRLIDANVRVVTAFGGDLGCVHVDPVHLEQGLLNLAINAIDAMPEGGALTIRTETTVVSGGSQNLPVGRYVEITVQDNGEGMDAETSSRIFEPFFTTKKPGQGTGLGLSSVYGMVKQSGGDIRVESKPGSGTKFIILLPRADPHLVDDTPEPQTEAQVIAKLDRGLTVLLVEDEPAVRELVRDILKLDGFQIMEAGDGQEALDLVHRHQVVPDLLLTDVIMPGMAGTELALRLRTEIPELRILYMSGYNEERLFQGDNLNAKGMAYLQKPFTPNDLSARVRQTLDL
jgi:signal transduction histidine kinase/CheY-like chemotaxis protein